MAFHLLMWTTVKKLFTPLPTQSSYQKNNFGMKYDLRQIEVDRISASVSAPNVAKWARW